MHTFRAPDKRRPVVLLSRDEALGLLHTIIVAPITSTIRNLPTEVRVGPAEGLTVESVVNLDHVQSVRQTDLGPYLGRLDERKMKAVCDALAVAVRCTPSQ
jgi:mRNA interferase MazF